MTSTADATPTDGTDNCPKCGPTLDGEVIDRADPTCPQHGADITTIEGISLLLRYAGVEVGSVNGENVRQAYARRMQPLLTTWAHQVHETAYADGVADERTSCQVTDHQVSPGRANPYDTTEF